MVLVSTRSLQRMGLIATAIGFLIGGLATSANALQLSETAGSESVVIVRGKIIDSAGKPARSAEVHLYVDPASTQNLIEGQAVNSSPISSVRTDSNGEYAVQLSSTSNSIKDAGTSERASLIALVEYNGHRFVRHIQPRITYASTLSKTEGGTSVRNASLPQADIQLGDPLANIANRSEQGASTARGLPATTVMNVKVIKDYGGRSVTVGTWSSDISNVTSRFTYSKGAESTLGIASSVSGKAGTFTVGESKRITSQGSVGFGTQKGAGGWQYKTQFRYQKKHYKWCAGFTCSESFRIEPVAWLGGATIAKSPKYSATHCVKHQKNTDFTLDKSAAWTFSAGVSVGGMTKVALSSQTGYNSSTKQTVAFGQRAYLCGKKSAPGLKPGAIRAKKW